MRKPRVIVCTQVIQPRIPCRSEEAVQVGVGEGKLVEDVDLGEVVVEGGDEEDVVGFEGEFSNDETQLVNECARCSLI